MSYYNRFTASLASKPRQAATTGGVKSSAVNGVASASTSNPSNSPNESTSKTRINKLPPGLPKAPSTSKSKSPGPPASRKRAVSNPPKNSRSPPYVPSDDFTSAVILRKKSPLKNLTSICTKDVVVKFPRKEPNKTAEKNVSVQKSASEPGAKDFGMNEGPIEIPEENFDFYRVITRPKVWEEDEEGNMVRKDTFPDEKQQLLFNSRLTQSCNMKTKESEIWGSLRTSTPGESSIPSLTSMLDEEKKSYFEATKEEEETEIIRDENNNVLSNIKNKIFRSFSFFDASRTTVDYNNNIVEEAKRAETDAPQKTVSFSFAKEESQREVSEEKVNTAFYNNNIRSSSAVATLEYARSEVPSVQDSALIPLEIEEQLNRVFQGDKSLHLNNRMPSLSEFRNSHDSLADMPPLTKRINPETQVGDTVLLQLRADPSMSEETKEKFHDEVNGGRATSTLSIASEESIYSETVTDLEEFDSQQTQTTKLDCQDAETGTESVKEKKKQKLMKLVMAVNNGVDIAPTEDKKKSVRIKGIMKTSRPGTPCSVTSNGSLSSSAEEIIRKRAIQERQVPQTFTQMGADYGFPSDISVSGLMGNLAPVMKWVSSQEPTYLTGTGDVKDESKENNANSEVSDGGEGSSLINKAFGILSAGLRYATSFMGDEADLEPREDTIRYNGYNIKVFGRKLLLESVHVNCNFNIDPNVLGRNYSYISLKSSTVSREALEQNCEGRRIRIVVRVTSPSAYKVDVNAILELEHDVKYAEGKWTLIYGKEEDRVNFVEIQCPTGVHPECLAYGFINGLLLIDAP